MEFKDFGLLPAEELFGSLTGDEPFVFYDPVIDVIPEVIRAAIIIHKFKHIIILTDSVNLAKLSSLIDIVNTSDEYTNLRLKDSNVHIVMPESSFKAESKEDLFSKIVQKFLPYDPDSDPIVITESFIPPLKGDKEWKTFEKPDFFTVADYSASPVFVEPIKELSAPIPARYVDAVTAIAMSSYDDGGRHSGVIRLNVKAEFSGAPPKEIIYEAIVKELSKMLVKDFEHLFNSSSTMDTSIGENSFIASIDIIRH